MISARFLVCERFFPRGINQGGFLPARGGRGMIAGVFFPFLMDLSVQCASPSQFTRSFSPPYRLIFRAVNPDNATHCGSAPLQSRGTSSRWPPSRNKRCWTSHRYRTPRTQEENISASIQPSDLDQLVTHVANAHVGDTACDGCLGVTRKVGERD